MKRHRSVAREEGMVGIVVRWALVLVFAWLASETALDLFSRGDRSGDVISQFVCMGFCYGLALAALGLVGILVRKRELNTMREEITGQELGAFLAARENHTGPMLELLRKLYAQFARNPAAVDAPTLLRLLHRRLSRNSMRVRRTGQLLVALGLIGTCVGLIGMLTGLAESVALAGKDGGPELMMVLFRPGGPMSGLGGAYSSTLLGIACGAVVLRGLANVLQDAVDSLVDSLEEFICVFIGPSFGA